MPEPRSRASLPMYDLPGLRQATDLWWAGIAAALTGQGFAGVPHRLERGDDPAAGWRHPDLLLGQCCGRDLVTHLAGTVVPVAIPSYRAPGCLPGSYRSWLVVRRGDPRRDLAAFAGATAAVNCTGSHSGWVALAHSLATVGLPERCLARGILTGSHRASLAAVARGEADLAAVDCVTFALLGQNEPELVAGLRILAESEAAPALPYVTASGRSAAERAGLAAALAAAGDSGTLAAPRAALLIDGFVVVPEGGDPYRRTVEMAETALRQPCSELA